MRVLGISAFYHDSAAALIEDGRLVGAAQEERFTRKKHDSGFPEKAVQYCLDEAGIKVRHLELNEPSLDDVFAEATGHRLEGAQ